MQGQLWRRVYQLAHELGHLRRVPRVQFSDTLIVVCYLWSVSHDRPTCWGCQQENWGTETRRPGVLPSPTTMSRRLRSVGVRHLLERLEAEAISWFPHSIRYWIDSKPLPVGGASKDREARIGRAAGGVMARGYRLHVLWNAAGVIVQWTLASMNAADAVIGEELIRRAGHAARIRNLPLGGYLNGDNLYDTNKLYEQSHAVGLQLVAPPRKKAKGLGHRKNSPHRLRGLELARERPIGHDLINGRRAMEGVFGTFGNYAGGLGPLPNWVRRPRRVSIWVGAKILFDIVRRAIKQRLTT